MGRNWHKQRIVYALNPGMLGLAATSLRNIRDNAIELGQVGNGFDFSQVEFSCSGLKVLSAGVI